MKTFLTIYVILFFNYVNAQTQLNNFSIDNDQLVWVKIFDTPKTYDQLTESIKDAGVINNIDIEDNKISGDLKPFEADYKGAGFSRGLTPIYILSTNVTSFVIIEYKEGRYRVTLKKIILTQSSDNPLAKQGETDPLDDFAIKNGKYRNNFINQASKIYDYSFNKIFEIKNSPKNDNW